MISRIGDSLLLLSMLLAIITILANGNHVRKFFCLNCLTIILAFLILVYGFIASDFSIQNIFLNSSTLTPLIFKITGSWSSHDGSVLLWLSLLSSVSLFFLIYSTGSLAGKVRQLKILSLIQLLFNSFIYFTSNPFIPLSFKPPEGLGLNPLLQDIAASIHPPLLYLGYVSYVIPFTVSCSMLWQGVIDKEGLKAIRQNSQFALLTLSTGIGLGSWWAYRELGWGGFWFFDPVENISLLPWLAGIALHHSILVTEKSGRLLSWTLSLSVITFLSTVLGMFLVRSGILSSVHAFAFSPAKGFYILAIFAGLAIASLSLLIQRASSIVFIGGDGAVPASVEEGIRLGNIFWLTGLIILLTGILYPVFYSLWSDSSVTINENYYIQNFLPIIMVIILLAGIVPIAGYYRQHIFTLMLSGTITFTCYFQLRFSILAAFAIFSGSFLVLQNLYLLLARTRYFKQPLSLKLASMILAHGGFGLLALSITFNSLLQSEIDFIGKVGDEASLGESIVTLQNIKFANGENYYRQIAEFWVQRGNITTILKPENRLYKIEKTLSQESDIYSYLTYDLYAVLNNIDDDIIHAKIYYRPFISFIWLSVLIISSGFLTGLIRRPE